MTPRTIASIRTACAGVLLGALAAIPPTDALAAKSKAITCTVSGSGASMVTTVALPSKSAGRGLSQAPPIVIR